MSEIETVREWIRNAGPCPTDTDLVVAVGVMLDDWREQRRSGMDVLASAAMDEIEETVAVMKEMI